MQTPARPIDRSYADIPGTYVFDAEKHMQGYHLNLFCKSLDVSANRDRFRAEPLPYLQEFAMTAAQRAAVTQRDWLALLRLGGNIYSLFKLAIFDGLTMQAAGAAMSGTGMTAEAFARMMINGGRPIAGNRSKRNNGEQ